MLLLSLIWGGASYWRMQRSLRWWLTQAAVERTDQADQIQNGLMQDLFALRLSLSKSLDLSQPNQTQPNQTQPNQTQPNQAAIETLYNTLYTNLNQLSAALSPPYIRESLPLAIQAMLQQWQAAHPEAKLQLALPATWDLEPIARSQVLLTTLAALLKLSEAAAISALSLELSQESGQAKLILRLVYRDSATRSAATHAKELRYLRDCFRCLMPGWCSHQAQPLADLWQLRWQAYPVENSLENPVEFEKPQS